MSLIDALQCDCDAEKCTFTEAREAIEKLNAFAAHKVECAMLIVLEVENEELCDCGLTDLRTQIFGKDG